MYVTKCETTAHYGWLTRELVVPAGTVVTETRFTEDSEPFYFIEPWDGLEEANPEAASWARVYGIAVHRDVVAKAGATAPIVKRMRCPQAFMVSHSDPGDYTIGVNTTMYWCEFSQCFEPSDILGSPYYCTDCGYESVDLSEFFPKENNHE